MNNEIKAVAIKYKKNTIYNGIFLYSPTDIILGCYTEYDNIMEDQNTGYIYSKTTDENAYYSEEEYAYNNVISYDELKEVYPELTEEEMLKEYYQEHEKELFMSGIDFNGKIIDKELNIDELIEGNIMNNNYPTQDYEYSEVIEENDPERLNNIYYELSKSLEKITDARNKVGEKLGLTESVDDKEETEELSLEEKIERVQPKIKELNSLIGLENIKKEISELIDYLIFQEKVSDIINIDNPTLHMFFTGNPGTGKTTVARIISEILYELGYVKNNNFIETTTTDFIGRYVGHTAVKTRKLIEEHKNSVIFIDEAYSFSAPGQKFGQEALVEILKEMEKNETVFIFAGYKDEMKDFIEMNSGLSSRIGYFLEYQDYSIEELYKIFERKIIETGLKIDEEARKKVIELIVESSNMKKFGNGRFINNLYKGILRTHAKNTKDINNKDELLTITKYDINREIKDRILYKNEEKPIGFVYQKKSS